MTIRTLSADQTRAVRHRVLWPHRPDVESCTIDEDGAPDARHLGAFTLNGDLVGVLSLFAQRSERFPAVIDPAVPVYRLRAMGVLPEFRRQRVGESLIAAACDTARTLGAAQLWCDAREAALPFYEALGFRCLSPTYEIPPIGPHRMMAREL